MSDIDLGPVGYLVVEFQGTNMTGEGLQELVNLADNGVIRILDLAFVAKQDDGSVVALDISDYDGDGEFDLTIFEGASSALLDDDDLNEAGSVLDSGSTAAFTGASRGSSPSTTRLSTPPLVFGASSSV